MLIVFVAIAMYSLLIEHMPRTHINCCYVIVIWNICVFPRTHSTPLFEHINLGNVLNTINIASIVQWTFPPVGRFSLCSSFASEQATTVSAQKHRYFRIAMTECCRCAAAAEEEVCNVHSTLQTNAFFPTWASISPSVSRHRHMSNEFVCWNLQ